jgi:flagellar motor protein MotB
MKFSLYLSAGLLGLLLTGCSNLQSEYEKQKTVITKQKGVIDELTDTNSFLNTQVSDLELKLKSNEIGSAHQTKINSLNNQYEAKLNNLLSSLTEFNTNLPSHEEITTRTYNDGSIGINLPGSILFRSGSASLSTQGNKVITHIVGLLEKYPTSNFRVEGHTDKDKIEKSKFKSNWELGSARSISVLEAILKKTSIKPAQFYVSSFSKYRPVSETSKKANRRVQIIILGSN